MVSDLAFEKGFPVQQPVGFGNGAFKRVICSTQTCLSMVLFNKSVISASIGLSAYYCAAISAFDFPGDINLVAFPESPASIDKYVCFSSLLKKVYSSFNTVKVQVHFQTEIVSKRR